MKEQNNCSCCGNKCGRREWCERCEQHIDKRKTFWDATYFAQHGKHCPFQVESLKLPLRKANFKSGLVIDA